jgi:CRP-like cAMP-binding protein
MELTPVTRKLSAFINLSDIECSVLDGLHDRRRSFAFGRDLVQQGQVGQGAFLLVSGWACSYKIQRDGQRQIIDFRLPGDFLGLRSLISRASDHSIEPITNIEVTEIQSNDILGSFAQTPRLTMAIFWAASRDEAMAAEQLVRVGRRRGAERVAHFLLELSARLNLIGIGNKDGFVCPLTQYLLADALGLSAVHVNRVMRDLREKGLVTFHDGYVSFGDYDKLVEFSDFDSTYLDQDGLIHE